MEEWNKKKEKMEQRNKIKKKMILKVNIWGGKREEGKKSY